MQVDSKQSNLSTSEMVKGRRVQVTLSADLERKLILWAYCQDERLPNWIKLVLRSQVEEQWARIQKLLEEKAARLNLPLKELERKILDLAGYDFNREMEELNEKIGESDD